MDCNEERRKTDYFNNTELKIRTFNENIRQSHDHDQTTERSKVPCELPKNYNLPCSRPRCHRLVRTNHSVSSYSHQNLISRHLDDTDSKIFRRKVLRKLAKSRLQKANRFEKESSALGQHEQIVRANPEISSNREELDNDDKNKNEESLRETINKNIKLKSIIKKLVHGRRRQKEKEAYYKYLNYLNNKYTQDNVTLKHLNKEYAVPEGPKQTDDFDQKSDYKTCNTCHHLIRTLYTDMGPSTDKKHYCTPISSCSPKTISTYEKNYQDIFAHIDTESSGDDRYNLKCRTSIHPRINDISYTVARNKDIVDHKESDNNPITIQHYANKEQNPSSNESAKPLQSTIIKGEASNDKDRTTDKYLVLLYDAENLKKLISNEAKVSPRNTSLMNIKIKIDTLMDSLNMFIGEVRGKLNNSSIIESGMKIQQIRTGIDTNDLNKQDKTICDRNEKKPKPFSVELNRHTNLGMASDKEPSPREDSYSVEEELATVELDAYQQKLHKINKSPTNNGSPVNSCQLHIGLSCGDKEDSTKKLKEKRHNRKHTMNAAVNTDAMGLITLLVMLITTTMRLLCFILSFDYFRYMAFIQIPYVSRRVDDYVCSICSAIFNTPLQLRKHMGKHRNKAREQCDRQESEEFSGRRAFGLFVCPHCGQRFVRSHCCELHQYTCPKRPRDSTQSVAGLRILK